MHLKTLNTIGRHVPNVLVLFHMTYTWTYIGNSLLDDRQMTEIRMHELVERKIFIFCC